MRRKLRESWCSTTEHARFVLAIRPDSERERSAKGSNFKFVCVRTNLLQTQMWVVRFCSIEVWLLPRRFTHETVAILLGTSD